MNSAPDYRWTCHKCSAGNPPGSSFCDQCGFPAVATGNQILGQNDAPPRGAGNEMDASEIIVRIIHVIIGIAIIAFALISAVRSSEPAPLVVAILLAVGIVPIAVALFGSRKLAFQLLWWGSI